MPDKKLGIENLHSALLEEDKGTFLKKLSEGGIPKDKWDSFYQHMPNSTIALERASFFYNPVDPNIMKKTSADISINECIELIKLNPEYLAAPFTREIIKSLRITLYDTNEEFKNWAKVCLRKISKAINQKERDHYPASFIAWQRDNIKKILRDNRGKISTHEEKENFIRERFHIEVDGEVPPKNIVEFADFIVSKLYGIAPDTVKQSSKCGEKFDLKTHLRNLNAIIE